MRLSNKFQVSTHWRWQTITGIFLACAMVFSVVQISLASEQWVQKYQKLAEQAGFSFTYGNLEVHSAGSFTLNDVTLIRYGIEDPVKIKSVTLNGIRELTGNGLAAQSVELRGLSWDGVDVERREMVVSVRQARIDGLYLPDPVDVDAPLFLFEEFALALDDLMVVLEGNLVLTVPSITSQFASSENSSRYSGFMKASGVNFFLSDIANSGNFMRQIENMGYGELNMDINLEADWDLNSGVLSLNRYELDIAKLGALDFQISLGGYSEQFARKLRSINAQMSTLTPMEQRQAYGRYLQTLGTLTLRSMKLSFRDGSITEKILARQALAMGQPVENMKAMVPIMLSGALAALQQPALAANLVGAFETFLAEPGIISVGATPAQPLSLAEITGMVTSLPDLLVEKLNITAEAR